MFMKKKENGTQRIKKPWPTKDAMEQVYEMKLWGNNASDFYSGIGSHHPELVDQMLPTMQRTAGAENVQTQKAITGAEDFSYFQREAPGFFFFLGGMTPGNTESFPHHTPDFLIDDSGLILGVKTLTEMSLDYLNSDKTPTLEAPIKGK